MPSLILSATSRALRPLLLLFSLFLLLRGHNEAGGGFVGGLVAASAIALEALAHGPQAARRALRVAPHTLLGGGLAVALVSGLAGLVRGRAFLAPSWHAASVPVVGKLGTPLLFDLGVYLVVLAVASTILLSLVED